MRRIRHVGLYLSRIAGTPAAAQDAAKSRAAAAERSDNIAQANWLQILDLVARYSHTFDSRDAQEWTNLFVDDAPFTIHQAGVLVLTLRTNAERLNWARETHAYLIKEGLWEPGSSQIN